MSVQIGDTVAEPPGNRGLRHWRYAAALAENQGRLLDELMMPDPRSASFVRVNLETGERAQIDIQDTSSVDT
jgi:hypothetical protein